MSDSSLCTEEKWRWNFNALFSNLYKTTPTNHKTIVIITIWECTQCFRGLILQALVTAGYTSLHILSLAFEFRFKQRECLNLYSPSQAKTREHSLHSFLHLLIPQTRTECLLSSVLDTKKTLVPQSLISRLINENSDFRTVNHVIQGESPKGNSGLEPQSPRHICPSQYYSCSSRG